MARLASPADRRSGHERLKRTKRAGFRVPPVRVHIRERLPVEADTHGELAGTEARGSAIGPDPGNQIGNGFAVQHGRRVYRDLIPNASGLMLPQGLISPCSP